MKLDRVARNIFAVLVFVNLTSFLVKQGEGGFTYISYGVRILLYLYILYKVVCVKLSYAAKENFIYRFSIFVSIFLAISLTYSVLINQDFYASFSKIFPTFFLLLDCAMFYSIGIKSRNNESLNEKMIVLFRRFAIVSIIGMSLLTVYVAIAMGSLEQFWNLARQSDGEYNTFLNAYKNVNPYRFAILIPFLFLQKKKYNIHLTVLAVINIIVAGKRGPLLALVLASSVLFIMTYKGKKKMLKYAIYAFVLFVLYFIFIDSSIFDNMIYRMDMSQHNQTDQTSFYMSGRNNLWTFVIDDFNYSSGFKEVFGHGILGSQIFLVKQTGISNAHNDWLEILYNYGFLGLIVFFTFVVYLVKKIFLYKCEQNLYFNTYLFVIVFMLTSTFYTASFYGGFAATGYATLLISYIIGVSTKSKLFLIR